MKQIKLLFCVGFTIIYLNTYSQNVGINEDNSEPASSAMLDIKSANKGLLIPRVELTDLGSSFPVTNPDTSLLIYNTSKTVGEGFYYWDGSEWVKLITGEGITDNDSDPENELQNLQEVIIRGNDAGTLRITNLGNPTAQLDATTKYYVDNNDDVNDADADPTNEIQNLQEVLGEGTSAGNLKITNLADPTSAQDAATKSYVDNNDDVNDADNDPTNEIQDLTLTDNTLSLSGDATNVDLIKYLDGGLNLPYLDTLNEDGDAFRIHHNGNSGSIADFKIENSSNNSDVIFAKTVGNGAAGYFVSENPSGIVEALLATTYGTEEAIQATTYGTGNCAYFRISNSSNSEDAVYAVTSGTGRAGYFSITNSSNSNNALYATTNGTGDAARFGGNVYASGSISCGGQKPFTIDHPLDLYNKILRHNSIESPEMINIYKGHAQLVDGEITIQLPDYFDALNHPDGREINLTPINGWSPLYLDSKIEDNQFTIKTTMEGNPTQEFSWVIYAVRNDAYAQDHPIIVEEEKGEGNGFKKGELLYKSNE